VPGTSPTPIRSINKKLASGRSPEAAEGRLVSGRILRRCPSGLLLFRLLLRLFRLGALVLLLDDLSGHRIDPDFLNAGFLSNLDRSPPDRSCRNKSRLVGSMNLRNRTIRLCRPLPGGSRYVHRLLRLVPDRNFSASLQAVDHAFRKSILIDYRTRVLNCLPERTAPSPA
jgi:hypothetical protein